MGDLRLLSTLESTEIVDPDADNAYESSARYVTPLIQVHPFYFCSVRRPLLDSSFTPFRPARSSLP